jgi:hypothetical protein
MSNRRIPSNQEMTLRLAVAAGEQPGASTCAGEEKRDREVAEARPVGGALG